MDLQKILMEILITIRINVKNVLKKDPKNIYSLTNEAIEFMNSSTLEKKPFFLQISHYVFRNIESTQESYNRLKDKPKGLFQKDHGFAMTYDLDQGIGILLDKIKELGIEDNTYIIYMSDNGSVPNIPDKEI